MKTTHPVLCKTTLCGRFALSALMAAVVAAGLAGCSGEEPATASAETSLQPIATATPTTPTSEVLETSGTPAPEHSRKAGCVYVASPAQAEKLLGRLFPKAEFHSFEEFKLGMSAPVCLLEVEMSVESDKPETRGFVYVLPDGERFLNGPLMDKRSRVSTTPTASPEIQAAMALQKKTLDSFASMGSQVQVSPPAPEASTSFLEKPADVNALRRELMAKLADLPQLTGGNPDGEPVYVLLDPLCGECQRMFAERDELAATHNIEWRWIPMFTSEKGWVKAATVLKVAESDPEKAMTILTEMMERKWEPNDHFELISALTEDDYARAKKSLEVFAEVAKSAGQTIGTPLVLFERPNKAIEVISGTPEAHDWQSLHPTAN